MCGIAGILRVHAPGAAPPPPDIAIPEAWLDILDESIKHRGPDGKGRFRDRAVRADGSVVDVAFVHRRLAIIDPQDGHQPMVSERGRSEGEGLVAVVFNGCIYNHRELRKELERAGHRFETDHSDTEVLVHGWREWGPRIVDHLDGMYGAAVWDRAAACVSLLRDPAGEKPVYYWGPDRFAEGPRTWAFASSNAALCALAAKQGRLGRVNHPLRLWSWISFGFNWHPLPHRGYALGPGHVTPDGPACELGPDREYARVYPPRTEDRVLCAHSLDQLLADAVESRLESDVPFGCFLSGGVDSSLVAAYANRATPGLTTFSVRMPDPRFDESKHAARVARHLGTTHHTLDCRAQPAEDLTRLVAEIGSPLGDSSLLPTYWVSRATRGHVKVALSGDGGDELFCGYQRYIAARWIERLRNWIPPDGRAVLAPIARSRRPRLRRIAEAVQGCGYVELLRIFGTHDTIALGCPPDLAEMPMNALFEVGPWPSAERIARRPDCYPLMLYDPDLDPPRFDFAAYLPYDLMSKVDTASMSVALEVRAPLLANSVVRSALAEPLDSLMPRGQRKGLLRQVARKYLPAEIVDRPKQGFAIPIGEWFRTDYGGMRQLLLDHLNSAEPWGPPSLGIDLNMKFVRQMLDEHMSQKRDHSQRLYMLLVLSIWAKWLGGL
jgi:asparagine synthase (glutamine-hydrolysing)